VIARMESSLHDKAGNESPAAAAAISG